MGQQRSRERVIVCECVMRGRTIFFLSSAPASSATSFCERRGILTALLT